MHVGKELSVCMCESNGRRCVVRECGGRCVRYVVRPTTLRGIDTLPPSRMRFQAGSHRAQKTGTSTTEADGESTTPYDTIRAQWQTTEASEKYTPLRLCVSCTCPPSMHATRHTYTPYASVKIASLHLSIKHARHKK